MEIKIAYAEIVAENTSPWLAVLAGLGARFEGMARAAGRVTTAWQAGAVRVLVSVPGPGDATRTWLANHGDGVWDIAFSVPDVAAAFTRARAAGLEPIQYPQQALLRDGSGTVPLAVVEGWGSLRHTLVQSPPPRHPGPFTAVDHLAICVDHGGMQAVADCYAHAFGMAWQPRRKAVAGRQGMDSGYLWTGDFAITVVAQDAAGEPGQVSAFLKEHGGPGVQHLAFRTPGIAGSVRRARIRGVEFLTPPGTYFDLLPGLLGRAVPDLAALRSAGVLADHSPQGWLRQTFTAPVRPSPVFFELIQRDPGVDGFGARNLEWLLELTRDAEA